MGQQEKKGLQWGQKQHWGQKQQMLNLGPCKGSKVLNSWYQGRARGVLCGDTGCAPHADQAPSTPVIPTAASPSFHPISGCTDPQLCSQMPSICWNLPPILMHCSP